MKLCSCFTPTLGRPELIEEILMMFQMQTYPNRELLVVDTAEQMPETEGDRWRIMHIGRLLPNWRDGYSMGTLVNAGIRATKGELTIRLDDDDQILPWHVEALVEALQDHQWACPYTVWDAQWGDLRLYRPYRDRRGPRDVAYAGTWAFTREAFEALGGYREDRFREEECEFRDRLAARFGDPGDSTAGRFPMSSYVYSPNSDRVPHYGQMTDQQRRAHQRQSWPPWPKITPRWPRNYLLGFPLNPTINPRNFG